MASETEEFLRSKHPFLITDSCVIDESQAREMK